MQDHRFDFEVEGTPDEVWDAMAAQSRATVTTDAVSIEILHPGDARRERPGPSLSLSRPPSSAERWTGPVVGVDHRGHPPGVVEVRRHLQAAVVPISTGWTRLKPTGPTDDPCVLP